MTKHTKIWGVLYRPIWLCIFRHRSDISINSVQVLGINVWHANFILKFALIKVKIVPENQFTRGEYHSLIKNLISDTGRDPFSVQLDVRNLLLSISLCADMSVNSSLAHPLIGLLSCLGEILFRKDTS